MLSVNHITKLYDSQSGVADIHFACDAGKIISVIGPNGSGKTTLLKIIAGILKADTGSVSIDEYDTSEYMARRIIGYMPDSLSLAHGLTVKNFLYMISDYKYDGMFKDAIDQAVSEFGLSPYLNKAFGRLSMGNQKKVSMAAAFIGNPRLIILDEPTNGVDTSAILTLKQYIRTAQDNGSVIILSSHILDFAGGISDFCIFLKNGKIAAVEQKPRQLEETWKRLY